MRQQFSTRFFSFILLSIFTFALFCNPNSVKAQNGSVGIDPTRIEVVIPAGTEKTIGTTVDYSREVAGVDLPLARLIARMEDWTIAPDGSVKFAAVNTLERSAASWVTASTSEFTMTPESRKTIRYTISVPKDTPPGDYYFAAYVESRDAPPPPKEGEKRITITFRHYLMVYVLVPGLTCEGELAGLEAKVVNGIPVVSPTLTNKGNSHLRPMQSFEIRDAADKVVFNSDPSEARVLLGGHSWQMPYVIEAQLPAGKYKLAYKVDFGDKKALQIGKTSFEITESDVAARKSLEEKAVAENAKETEKAEPAPEQKDAKDVKAKSAAPEPSKTDGDTKSLGADDSSMQSLNNGLSSKKPLK